MTKKKAKKRGVARAMVNGQETDPLDVSDEGDETVHGIEEWRRLRGLKNRLSAALHTLDRESQNGPIAFEHFLAKCRDIVGLE